MADENKAQDLDMDLEFEELNDLEDDLNSYGVFVKADSDDSLTESPEADLSDLDDTEFDGDISLDLEEEDIDLDLSEEEENLLADLEPDDALASELNELAGQDEDFQIENLDETGLEFDDGSSSSPGLADVTPDEDEEFSDLGDLGDLSALEEEINMALDEEEEDETIYLEEDDLKLELENDGQDLVLEDDEFEDEIVIPDLDSSLDDISIPELDDVLEYDNPEPDSAPVPAAFSENDELDIEGLDLPDDFSSMDAELSEEDIDLSAHEDVLQEISLDDFMDRTSPEESEQSEDTSNDFTMDEDFESGLDDESLSQEGLEPDIDLEEDFLSIEEESLDLDEDDLDLDESALSLDESHYQQDSHLPGADEDVVTLDDLPDTDYSEDLTELESDMDESLDSSFDDVAALSDSLADSDDGSETAVVNAIRASEELEKSEGVLLSIEQELSAIKSELMDLREELRRIRGGAAHGSSVAPGIETRDTDDEVLLEDSETSSEFAMIESGDEGMGFFSTDDEDETIALTGDELDNILNTAEFTEESGESTILPDEDEFSSAFEDSSQDRGQITKIELESEDPFAGNEDELTAMADLDIEEELSGIDDLKDEEEEIQLYTGEELEDMELEIPDLGTMEDTSGAIDGVMEQASELEIEDELPDEILLTDEENAFTENPLQASDFDDIESLSEPEELGGLSDDEAKLLSPEHDDLDSEYLDLSGEEEIEEVSLEDIQEPGPARTPTVQPASAGSGQLTSELKQELKAVLTYMDSLLENLPEEKIEEFAQSEHFATYQKLFEELGL